MLFDFLPAICGQAVVDRILGEGRKYYCPADDAFIPVEFAVAAYRFGHSMIPQKLQLQKGKNELSLFGNKLGKGFTPLSNLDAVPDWHELFTTSEGRQVQKAEKLDAKLAPILLALPFIQEGEASLATRNLFRGQAFLLPSGEALARRMGRPENEIEDIVKAAKKLAKDHDSLPESAFDSGIPLWFYLLLEGQEVGRESAPDNFDKGEGLGPVGARIVAETLIGLIALDPHSFLGSDRSWYPAKGVGVSTVGEMLTYGSDAASSDDNADSPAET